MAIQRNCNPVLQVWKSLQSFKVTMITFFETLLCTNYCIISFNPLSYVSYFLQRSNLGLREITWLPRMNTALDGKVKILSPFKFIEGFHWCTFPITSTWEDKTCMLDQIQKNLGSCDWMDQTGHAEGVLRMTSMWAEVAKRLRGGWYWVGKHFLSSRVKT